MFLRKLYISGFKSFANPSQLDFDGEVSAIVGPNGSGKSNISDAIRFVLGESRTKQMRSQRMEDIIFSGTDSEKARGVAEVRLVLGQEEGQPDLVVSRKYFRTGESAYTINGRKVRLKDIHALFADTGLGKNGYSIVSQGGVDSIIGAGPQEIREIVEEAAGIAGYKAKRNETQKRLQATQENIERLKDIVDEVEHQLRSLKRQAEKTRRFLEINEILKVIDLVSFFDEQTLNFEELEELGESLDTSEHLLKNLEEKSKLLDAEYLACKDEYRKSLEESEELQRSLDSQKDELSTIRAQSQVEESTLEHEKGDLIRLETDIRREGEDLDKFKETADSLALELDGVLKRRAETGQALREERKRLERVEDELKMLAATNAKAQDEARAKEERARSLNESLISLKGELADINVRYENSSKELEGIDKSLEELDLNAKSLNKDRLKVSQLQRELADKIAKLKGDYDRGAQKAQRVRNDLERLRADETVLESKLDYQKRLKASYSGYQNSVKAVMGYANSKLKGKVYGPAAELFKTEKRYALGIQVALGAKAQNILVESEATASSLIEYLKKSKKGRATFLPLDSVRVNPVPDKERKAMGKAPGFLGKASELITTEPRFKKAFDSLLGRVMVLEDFETASNFRRRFPRYTAVTLSGEIFYPGGAIVGGSTGKETQSVLFTSLEIDNLQNDLKRNRGRLRAAQDEYSGLVGKAKDVGDRIRQNQTELSVLKQKGEDLQAKIERNGAERAELEGRRNSLNPQSLSENKRRVEAKISEVKKEIEDIGDLEVQDKDEENRLRDEIIEIHQSIARKEIAHNAVKQQELEVRRRISEANSSISGAEDRRRQWIKERDELSAQREERVEYVKGLYLKIEERESAVERLGKSLSESRDELGRIDSKRGDLEGRIKEMSHQRVLEAEAKSKVQTQIERVDLKRQNLKNKIFELYGVNYAMVHSQIDELRKRQEELKDVDFVALREERAKIGSVNTEAVDEYEQMRSRHSDLKSQYDDLTTAEKDIYAAIDTLNETMESQFKDRFDAINERFASIFHTLFEGGSAKLEYTDPKDVLNSGIELSAQPPGKHLKHISLLSGGEKAMTAIALLFSFIELNPAPFTIIDEIDAPLDESNIYRFTHYIEEMSSRNQFIIITHRRSTLRICDKINGVTMASDGVSRLCTLTVSEYLN